LKIRKFPLTNDLAIGNSPAEAPGMLNLVLQPNMPGCAAALRCGFSCGSLSDSSLEHLCDTLWSPERQPSCNPIAAGCCDTQEETFNVGSGNQLAESPPPTGQLRREGQGERAIGDLTPPGRIWNQKRETVLSPLQRRRSTTSCG